MFKDLPLRGAFGSLLIALTLCGGCRAATKTPVPPAATDAALATDAGQADGGVRGRVLLGDAVGL